MIDLHALMQALAKYEGQVIVGGRHVAYDDATGKPVIPGVTVLGHLTCGYGRNIEECGLSDTEARHLLQNDAMEAADVAKTLVSNWDALGAVRQEVLAHMVFNLGLTKVKHFSNMLTAVEQGDWVKASGEMLNSLWANQVGHRAMDLAKMMLTGQRGGA